LFNSAEVQDRAIALADRLRKEQHSDPMTIGRLFQLALSREVTEEEVAACLLHWQKATGEEEMKTYPSKPLRTEVTRTVMAEKTGEPYQFVEQMPVYRHYQPDLQPGDVDAKTRGLAQVCLVVFNLNEFAYLD
jgi:hypothetical protein